jgi:hypothetical protein
MPTGGWGDGDGRGGGGYPQGGGGGYGGGGGGPMRNNYSNMRAAPYGNPGGKFYRWNIFKWEQAQILCSVHTGDI